MEPKMSEHRSLHVPEGLTGERIDAAMARMLGLSRTKAADLIDNGHVTLNDKIAKPSDKVHGEDFLEVHFPDEVDQLEVKAECLSVLACYVYPRSI